MASCPKIFPGKEGRLGERREDGERERGEWGRLRGGEWGDGGRERGEGATGGRGDPNSSSDGLSGRRINRRPDEQYQQYQQSVRRAAVIPGVVDQHGPWQHLPTIPVVTGARRTNCSIFGIVCRDFRLSHRSIGVGR